MGTKSSKKFLKVSQGIPTEEAALTTSAGAADANAIPALGAAGVLDASIFGGVTQSAGAASQGKVPLLDSTGRIDTTVLPTGIGADTAVLPTSEAVAAGDFVNIWNNAGTANVRKADASATGKEAHGFVLAGFASGAQATVYFEGTNGQCTGLTPGPQFLSGSTPGKTVLAAGLPTAAGSIVQRVGIALSATAINVEFNDVIVLAG